MSSSNDCLILMVKCLYDVGAMLKIGTREQLSRANLISIKAYCLSCMSHIKKEDADRMYFVMMSLNAVIEVCSTKLSEVRFMETDIEEKNFIVNNINDAKSQLCLIAGRHYTKDNTFNFTPSMNVIYKYIVDVCIENNYYFGLEDEIKGGAQFGY